MNIFLFLIICQLELKFLTTHQHILDVIIYWLVEIDTLCAKKTFSNETLETQNRKENVENREKHDAEEWTVPWQRVMAALRLLLRKILSSSTVHCLSYCFAHIYTLLWLLVKNVETNKLTCCVYVRFFLRIETRLSLRRKKKKLLTTKLQRYLQSEQQSKNINKCAHSQIIAHVYSLSVSLIWWPNNSMFFFFYLVVAFNFTGNAWVFFPLYAKSSCNQNMKSNFLFLVKASSWINRRRMFKSKYNNTKKSPSDLKKIKKR